MITKKELKSLIKLDKQTYFRNKKSYYYNCLIKSHLYMFMKTIIISRKRFYYKDKLLKSKIKFIYSIPYFIYGRRYNRLSSKYNIFLLSKFGKEIKIFHEGIVVNSNSHIGNNILFHGNNCVGNDGKDFINSPEIGNNVEFGYGSSVIGNIKIADDVIIGAHALVNTSILEKGSIVVGCPAKVIGNKFKK